MSKLIYTGDIIQNFGKYVPTPYIEKVSIEDQHITVRIAIFLALEDYSHIDSMSTTLSQLEDNLYVYGLFIPMIPYVAGETGQGNKLTKEAIDKMMSEKKLPDDDNIFDYLNATYMSTEEYEVNVTNYFQVRLRDFEDSGQSIYTEDGKAIRKLTYETSEPWTETIHPGDWSLKENPDHLIFFSWSSFANYDPKLGTGSGETAGISVGAFYASQEDILSGEVSDSNFRDAASRQSEFTSNPVVNAATSDIAFEPIFLNGELQVSPHVQYVTIAGDAYDGIPLIDLSYVYHSTIDLTHATIVGKFKELVGQFSKQRANNETLASALEQIEYILSVHGNEPDLMLKLRDLQVYFPEKVRGTPTGRLYRRYNRIMNSFLDALTYEPVLTKVLLRNAKLVDRRDPNVLFPYVSPGQHWWSQLAQIQNSENGINDLVSISLGTPSSGHPAYDVPASATGHPYLFGGGAPNEGAWDLGREMYPVLRLNNRGDPIFREEEARTYAEDGGPTADRQPRNVRNFGYFYCDVEKIINTDTFLSQVFNVAKVESLFGGKSLTNLVFDIDTVTLKRGVWNRSLNDEDIFGNNGYNLFQTMTSYTANSTFLAGQFADLTPGGTMSNTEGFEQARESDYGQETRITENLVSAVNETSVLQFADQNKLNKSWPKPALIEYDISRNYPEMALTMDNAYNQGLTYGSDMGSAGNTTGQQGPNNLSFIIPRNFELCSSDPLGDYRLLAYEFQDFYSADYGLAAGARGFGDEGEDVLTVADFAEVEVADSKGMGEFYQFKLRYRDMSANVVIKLMANARNTLEQLAEYLEYAEQKCSYNNIDDNFNSFFAEGVKEIWPQSDVSTPWARAPIVYNVHRDLLFDLFGGDKEQIKDASRAIMDNINPVTGRLSDLQHFYDVFSQLYADYYASDGDVMVALKEAVGASSPMPMSPPGEGDWVTEFESGTTAIVDFRTHKTLGTKFPPIFYNYPEAANAEDQWSWEGMDSHDLLMASMAWGVMDHWYSSYGVNAHYMWGQGVFTDEAGKANESFLAGGESGVGLAAQPIFTYFKSNGAVRGDPVEKFANVEWLQNKLAEETAESIRQQWLNKLREYVMQALGWAKRSVPMWDNHKKGLREANVAILWNTIENAFTFKKTGDKTGEHCYAHERGYREVTSNENASFDLGDYSWGRVDNRKRSHGDADLTYGNVNIVIPNSHDTFVGYSLRANLPGYSRGFNAMNGDSVEGYNSSNVICNPIGYVIKKIIDWAPDYDYLEYCNQINKQFLWTTMHGTATGRNSASDDDVNYAFSTSNKNKIDQAAQYKNVLEDWANQIIRHPDGGNSERYGTIIMIARMVYCMCGKESFYGGARGITENSGYWTGRHTKDGGDGLFSSTSLVDWFWNQNIAVTWTSLDPRNNWLVFDPDNSRHRQIYKKGKDIGSRGTDPTHA